MLLIASISTHAGSLAGKYMLWNLFHTDTVKSLYAYCVLSGAQSMLLTALKKLKYACEQASRFFNSSVPQTTSVGLCSETGRRCRLLFFGKLLASLDCLLYRTFHLLLNKNKVLAQLLA